MAVVQALLYCVLGILLEMGGIGIVTQPGMFVGIVVIVLVIDNISQVRNK